MTNFKIGDRVIVKIPYDMAPARAIGTIVYTGIPATPLIAFNKEFPGCHSGNGMVLNNHGYFVGLNSLRLLDPAVDTKKALKEASDYYNKITKLKDKLKSA